MRLCGTPLSRLDTPSSSTAPPGSSVPRQRWSEARSFLGDVAIEDAMSPVDLAGWLAAALTLGAFSCRDMVRLRTLAVLANLAFIAYGAGAALWPVLALHLALLPVNLRRLYEQRPLKRWATVMLFDPLNHKPAAGPSKANPAAQQRHRLGAFFNASRSEGAS